MYKNKKIKSPAKGIELAPTSMQADSWGKIDALPLSVFFCKASFALIINFFSKKSILFNYVSVTFLLGCLFRFNNFSCIIYNSCIDFFVVKPFMPNGQTDLSKLWKHLQNCVNAHTCTCACARIVRYVSVFRFHIFSFIYIYMVI